MLQEHFESFCEDYNTATMPSKKYYNIAAWHAKARCSVAGSTRAARLWVVVWLWQSSQSCPAQELERGRKKEVAAVERTAFDDEAVGAPAISCHEQMHLQHPCSVV